MADHSRQTPTQDRPVAPAGAAEFPLIQGGRYTFIEIVGAGGAGTVYRALDTVLDKQVAIKKLHNSASITSAMRFQREAQVAGALRHENVMSARDFGLTDKNEPYLILDFVEGETLSSLVKRVGALPVTDAINIFIQLADGLIHAHAQGVVHRDIKPSNAMLVAESDPSTGTKRMVAKIVDFGLAKSIDDEQRLTKTNVSVGTPGYMSPEQMHGETADKRSDIYSFGCLMFYVLSGAPPFASEGLLELSEKQIGSRMPSLIEHKVECSRALEEIVSRCLRPKLDERFHTVAELKESLISELERVENEEDSADQNVTTCGESDSKLVITGVKHREMTSVSIVVAALVLILMVVLGSQTQISKTDSADSARQIVTDTGAPGLKSGKQAKGKPDPFDVMGSLGTAADGLDKSWSIDGATDEQALMLTKSDAIKEVQLQNSRLTSLGFSHIASLGTVKEITIVGGELNRTLTENLAKFKSLESLKFLKTESNDFGALAVFAGSDISELDLVDLQLNESAFENLAKIGSLGSLRLDSCRGLNPVGLKRLTQLPKLWQIRAEGTDITDDGIKALCDSPSLAELFVASTSVTDESLKHLAALKKLSILDVNHCSVSQSARRELKRNLPALRFYDLQLGDPLFDRFGDRTEESRRK